tara:strand:+ start:1105 stop:1539 length:435 start_codon:yes stop_codon:yes gene_type:complete
MILNPEVWGPHYWFVLYSVAISYPKNVNRVTKRKYYDFIQNLPLFLPVGEMGKVFSDFLDRYPVTPYLDSRESFIKWIHFIHNKINVYLGKKEITYAAAMKKYYEHYIPKTIKKKKDRKNREKYIFFAVVLVLIIVAILLMYSK